MHRVTVVHRTGRAPPPGDDQWRLVAARWDATHTLTTTDLHALLTAAATRGITLPAALDELHRPR